MLLFQKSSFMQYWVEILLIILKYVHGHSSLQCNLPKSKDLQNFVIDNKLLRFPQFLPCFED